MDDNENKLEEDKVNVEKDQMREININVSEKKFMKKTSKNILVWLVIIVVLILLGIFLNKVVGDSYKGYSKSNDYKNPFVGVLYVEGTIGSQNMDSWGAHTGYQHKWTLDKIDSLIDDNYNQGILIFVNTPGGGVYESDELYLKIKEYKEVTSRPVYVAMGSMAASGGYYISAPADKIYANRNAWTGSIGVTIGTLIDVSQLLDKYGIKTVTIAEGANKSMGSSVDPLTKEQEDILRGLVHEAYLQFVSIVSEERGLDLEKTKAIADGRIYTAKQAKELKLIDGVCSFDETKSAMTKDEGLFGCDFVDIIYRDNSFLGKVMGAVDMPKMAQSDLSIVMNLVNKESQFKIAYLYQ